MTENVTFEQYRKGLEEGRLLGLMCASCGTVTCPPMAVCRSCGSPRQRPVTLSGKGIIRTFTVIRIPPEGRKAPYVVAMVELEEGPWVMGALLDVEPHQADMHLMDREVRVTSLPLQSDTFGGPDRVLAFRIPEA